MAPDLEGEHPPSPFEPPSEEGYRMARELGVSATPPPGVRPRMYFFAAAPDGKVDAVGLAEMIADLHQVLDDAQDPTDLG